MMQEMQEVYAVGGVSSHGYCWKPDDVAVAPSDKLFYRVRVLSVSETDPDSVQVYLIDYGKQETVRQRDITLLLKQFEKHHAFSMPCHLHGIRPAGDRGKWTGFAIDFLKNMLNQTKKLFLVPKVVPGGQGDETTSLPCDLEAEEQRNMGALEPVRRIRTSFAGKLVEQGLAFSNSRGAQPVDSSGGGLVGALPPQRTVQGTQPPGEAGGVAESAASLATAAAEPLGSPSDAGSEAGDEEQEEIPLGGDWATISGRRREWPEPLLAEGASSELCDLELNMLAAEQAAEAVEERALEVDWLPARVPTETRFIGRPTHVTMAGTVYLHTYPKGKETLDILQQAFSSKYGGSQPRPCDSYWFEGQPCIAKYFLDDCWYRAKVLQVHSEKVSVQFVDYGNTDRVAPTELRKNVFMEHVPVQALHCELHNILPLTEDGTFPVKTLNFLHSQIVERECHVQVHHFNAARRRFLVSLQLVQSAIDVNELLVKMGDARYMTDEELAAAAGGAETVLDALLLRAPYPRLQLPAGGTPVPVICIGTLSPCLLLVQPQRVAGDCGPRLRQLAAHLEAIDALPERLAEEAPAQPLLESPAVGSPCVCQFSDDKAWYRAVVLSVDGDAARVQYVDWGNMEEVRTSSLRQVPASMRDVPAWVLLVELYRVSPASASGWTAEAHEAVQACVFQQDVQLWARVKHGQREPPLLELVVFDEPESPEPKPRLAYQKAIDDGLVVLSAAGRRP
ncbi:tudor domain-containing protein 1-like [Pollicipes pollicipes]|uniref:tudor domain-containing protein 1-like n=1 Tax=Pollicipes pollicipes TaxID=41117 RepID=UPI001885908D|nr:tudor domain-containing protein 1-like [Pollicipes pollicipes]